MVPRTTAATTRRTLKPRATSALAIAPITITDRTCAALTGLEPKVWRAIVVKLGVRHVLAGRRMIVLVADWTQALERAATVDADDDDDDTRVVTESAASVDSLLARIGRERRSA